MFPSLIPTRFNSKGMEFQRELEAGPGRLDFSFPFPEFAAGEHQGPVRYCGETGTLIWDH